MASENRSPLLLTGLLVFLSTAILVWFGNGLNPWWPLLWFAPLPLLVVRPAYLLVEHRAGRRALVADRKPHCLGLLPYSGNAVLRMVGDILHGVPGFRLISLALPGTGLARRRLERHACVPGGVGHLRIRCQLNQCAWYCGQSCLHAAQVSGIPATRLDHWPLGHDLPAAPLFRGSRHRPASESDSAEASFARRHCGPQCHRCGTDLRRDTPGAATSAKGSGGRAHRL